MSGKRIAIIGAGPGGLTAALILANRGFEVDVYERFSEVGGRNGEFKVDEYLHDVGPTFLMLTYILEDIFKSAGKNLSDYMTIRKLDPMYRLIFKDFSFDASQNLEKVAAQVKEIFPGNQEGIERFFETESNRFDRVYPPLQRPYHQLREFLHPSFLGALPHMGIGRSMYDMLGNYFGPEKLRICFSFQAKYMGMSPWDCPAVFTIIPLIEYKWGIYHVIGGLNRISRGMAKAAKEEGARIHLNTPVKKIILDNRVAKGVELADGTRVEADDVVINADFGWAMSNLVEPGVLKKWTPEKLRSRKFSCSTFMLYLGLDKRYDMAHHSIVFADDYRKNIEEVANLKVISDEYSYYVRNASVIDPEIAPEGHSSLYVLVPVPNQKSGIDWDKESDGMRDKILEHMSKHTPMTDIKDHIVSEMIYTPADWQNKYNVYLGATFNLGHNTSQMLYWRPHNKFEEIDHCYLVGGGTHPGSGLPTIYESGRISANLICRQYGVPYIEPNPLPGS